jgi:hypothetical protein
MANHPHTIDRWDDATSENLIEQIAAVGDYRVALETYRAAVKRREFITLRDCRGAGPPAVALLHHRRRGSCLRRSRPSVVRASSEMG